MVRVRSTVSPWWFADRNCIERIIVLHSDLEITQIPPSCKYAAAAEILAVVEVIDEGNNLRNSMCDVIRKHVDLTILSDPKDLYKSLSTQLYRSLDSCCCQHNSIRT